MSPKAFPDSSLLPVIVESVLTNIAIDSLESPAVLPIASIIACVFSKATTLPKLASMPALMPANERLARPNTPTNFPAEAPISLK